jgi:hypothetical protein
MSPPRLLRNRRIIESDSSDDGNPGERFAPQAAAAQPQRSPPQGNDENHPPQPALRPQLSPQRERAESPNVQQQRIEISDSDSSDSMYVPANWHQSDANQNALSDARHNDPAVPMSIRQNVPAPQHQQLTPQRQGQPYAQTPPHLQQPSAQSTPQRQQPSAQTTPQRQQNSQQLQRQPSAQRQRQGAQRQQRPASPPRQRRRFTAQADSTSEEESSHESADESDDNAAAMYRSAILGVRNRPNAAQQVIDELCMKK